MRKFKKICTVIMVMIFAISIDPIKVQAISDYSTYEELPAKKDVEVNKVWKVKFNLSLDGTTVNTDNIKVEDKWKRNLDLKVKLDSSDDKSILVDLPTLGYLPGKEYNLIVGTNVMSKSGCKLVKPMIMKFTIKNSVEDGSSYSNLPQVTSIKMNDSISVDGKKQFTIVSDNASKVQYRVYAYKYNEKTYRYELNKELTNGYISSVSGDSPYVFSYNNSLEIGEYKIVVYVKRANSSGVHEDLNTDFDNYSTTYFRCLDSVYNEVSYKDYNISFEEIVNKQYKSNSSVYGVLGYATKASKNLIDYYMKPLNFLDSLGKYMFMKLDYFPSGVTEEHLDKVLKGKGVLDGKGKAFIDSCKKYNINPIYLVVHALHETGNGTSQLSKGVEVKTVNGKSVTPKITYNFFGIKAIDSNPLGGGSQHAYTEGWFTPEAAIDGGAKYIANRYLHNNEKFFEDRYTLYNMKWNPKYPASYQYATDVNWAYKQVQMLNNYFGELLQKIKFNYELPRYK